MRAFRLWIITIILILLLTACSPAKPRGTWKIESYGADQHIFTDGEVFFEGWEHSRKIFFQKGVPKGEFHVVEFSVPYGIAPGTYRIKPGSKISPSFTEWHEHPSGMGFQDNPTGTLTVIEAGKVFTGKIDFSASSSGFAIPAEKARVIASFENIPYTRLSDAPFQPGIDDVPADKKPGLVGPFAALSLVFLMLAAAVSVSFQVYVGRQVFAGRNPVMILLLASNPTRTYLRGWRIPSLNRVMRLWTLVILLAVMALCMLFFSTEMGQGIRPRDPTAPNSFVLP